MSDSSDESDYERLSESGSEDESEMEQIAESSSESEDDGDAALAAARVHVGLTVYINNISQNKYF